ncbi:MAG: hypothetical protein JWO72_1037 [Caulobacteraceae bacterium]|nr:hypothetical protein [Caulobacteraceae bacterium]
MPCIREGIAIILTVTVLAGCATAPPAAVVTYAHKDCPASPDLSAAISLTPPKDKAVYSVTTRLDAMAPCLSRQDGASPYHVYALPEDAETKTVTVGSILEQTRLLPPQISILDREGKVRRSFSTADYFFRGTVYSVQFQPRAGDAYVLVATDPARVGQEYNSISIGTSTSSTYANGAAISWTSGVDQRVSRIFSYEGSVEVTLYNNPTDKQR